MARAEQENVDESEVERIERERRRKLEEQESVDEDEVEELEKDEK